MILAQILLMMWLLTRLLPRRLGWLAVVLAFCTLLPIGHDLSVAAALRALWGDPSITSVQLLALSLTGRLPATFTKFWRAPALIAGIGLVLYPLALGLGDFDPYRLGFQPAALVALMAVPALARWWQGRTLGLWLLAIDLLAFACGILESTNFWDYAIDPLLASACLVLAFRNYSFRNR